MLDLVQWPAMVVTVLAAWLVASRSARKRMAGFWCFIASNALWIIWGVHADAYALIVLQIALAILNIRGVVKNEQVADKADPGGEADRVEPSTSPVPAS